MIVATKAAVYPVDMLVAEIEHLVLNEHVNYSGLCAVCGSAFPCGSAVLAEHTIALI